MAHYIDSYWFLDRVDLMVFGGKNATFRELYLLPSSCERVDRQLLSCVQQKRVVPNHCSHVHLRSRRDLLPKELCSPTLRLEQLI